MFRIIFFSKKFLTKDPGVIGSRDDRYVPPDPQDDPYSD